MKRRDVFYSETNMEFRACIMIMMLSAGFYIPLW